MNTESLYIDDDKTSGPEYQWPGRVPFCPLDDKEKT